MHDLVRSSIAKDRFLPRSNATETKITEKNVFFKFGNNSIRLRLELKITRYGVANCENKKKYGFELVGTRCQQEKMLKKPKFDNMA